MLDEDTMVKEETIVTAQISREVWRYEDYIIS